MVYVITTYIKYIIKLVIYLKQYRYSINADLYKVYRQNSNQKIIKKNIINENKNKTPEQLIQRPLKRRHETAGT